jgi:membrane protease YdiL (CAAX protease family)
MHNFLNPENRLFVLARQSRRLPSWVLSLTMAEVFVFVGQLAGAAILFVYSYRFGGPFISLLLEPILGPSSQLANLSPVQSAVNEIILLIFSFVPIALLLWLWVKFRERRAFWTLGLEKAGALGKYVRGMAFGILLFGLVTLFLVVTGFATYTPASSALSGLSALGGVLLVYIGWTIQGPVEEMLTRGWLMQVIGSRYKPWLGVVLSAVTFASLHALNPHVSAIAILNLVLTGLLFSLVALWDGSIWGVCGLHAAWNWAEGNLFGFSVSGTTSAGGSLLSMTVNGSSLWTGGAFGPEGGLIDTLVYLAAIGAFLWLLYRKNQSAADVNIIEETQEQQESIQ